MTSMSPDPADTRAPADPSSRVQRRFIGGLGAFPRHRDRIPSATGLGLAFVMQGFDAISMFTGALLALLPQRSRPEAAEAYVIPAASA
jgi:hypothetical protein